ncbi:testis-specific Y-encoded protein 2-like isoform X2 [Pteropus medius]|uniref:testis-specific Y-encoded protein 2-like isoform X2 n=1 Tax=Pteropus vampyrus TaxID=132908 RepID=UPI00196B124D|nr:testis-specific Y-encoded protein 2-like isoform X2 [Pteropus giganteus]
MSAMMGEQDANRLSYMTNLQVEDVRHRPDCCRIVLFFASNTYFREKVVAKEYVMNGSGYRASRATPVRRYQHYEREACSRRHADGRRPTAEPVGLHV